MISPRVVPFLVLRFNTMKICLAQTKAITADISANINKHLSFINRAVEQNADLIVFPELSLTGYEPELANKLATSSDDARFEVFQEISDSKKISIAVGMPLKLDNGISISTIIFRANSKRLVYSKEYLHADEKPFFVAGSNPSPIIDKEKNIALAICYEISVAEHAQKAAKEGAKIYIASVAKFASGVVDANKRLAEIAKKYNMTALMVNAVGEADGGLCDGGSAVWDSDGIRLEPLPNNAEGLIIFDL